MGFAATNAAQWRVFRSFVSYVREMTRHPWALIAAALMLWPCISNAEMYKCVEDGKTVFQDKPCRGTGSAITVVPANQSVEKSKSTEPAESADDSLSTRSKKFIESSQRDREIRDIDNAIENAEREVSREDFAESTAAWAT